MKANGRLIFFCGKMGAGKTTKSKKVAHDQNAVLISEDEWLGSLFPGQITKFDDYLKFSRQLKPLVTSHVQNILRTGTDVVMDFPANTVSQRRWFKTLYSEIDAPHELIYMNISDEICLKQIAQRRLEQPERASFDTEEVFHHVTSFFEEPNADEGFNIKRIEGSV
ncbi:AAA family ATPase [Desulfospira joergensenii]|uniref:AAA family ATPase n=1 Tax=Desulfospira joergensenii TaxID=53329 RepID=UPI0003B54BB4|nr:ATP-binding protein [Desulfospira joergensenii]